MSEKLKSGDILHCRRSTFLSWLIQKLTKSQFSHSALYINIGGESFVVDAQKDGVNLRRFDLWMKKYKYSFIVSRPNEMTSQRKAIILNRIFKKIGVTNYDFVGLLYKSPWKLITGKWKVGKNEDNRMYCSEFVAYVYDFPFYYKLSPEDLYDRCKNGIEFKTIEL